MKFRIYVPRVVEDEYSTMVKRVSFTSVPGVSLVETNSKLGKIYELLLSPVGNSKENLIELFEKFNVLSSRGLTTIILF